MLTEGRVAERGLALAAALVLVAGLLAARSVGGAATVPLPGVLLGAPAGTTPAPGVRDGWSVRDGFTVPSPASGPVSIGDEVVAAPTPESPAAEVAAPVPPVAPVAAEPAEPTSVVEDVVEEPVDEPHVHEPAPLVTAASWSMEVHSGLGAWVDVYDWTLEYTGGNPPVTTATMTALADRGVRTLYIQTTRPSSTVPVMEPDRLSAIIDAAHHEGLSVVTWFLPTFEDPAEDLRRAEAALALDVDGFALDIESGAVGDISVRNRRMLELSGQIRSMVGDAPLVATVYPPVQLDENTALWPDFPWAEVGALYDVVQPMAYFSFRSSGSKWRDAEVYLAENIRRIRQYTGRPEMPVHIIGGIADRTTVEDVRGMTRAAQTEGAMGASLYDVVTTHEALWEPMQAWRELR